MRTATVHGILAHEQLKSSCCGNVSESFSPPSSVSGGASCLLYHPFLLVSHCSRSSSGSAIRLHKRRFRLPPAPGHVMNTADRPLFGGAALCAIPPRFTDISDFREVPDNQEVFADARADQSIIIEFVEPLPGVQGQDVALKHFEALAEDNEASDRNVVRVEALTTLDLPAFPNDWAKYALYGTQTVAKHNEQARNTVNVYLCVIRLPSPYDTDIVITLNDVEVNPESSAATYIEIHPSPDETMALWKSLLESFKINDYSLFEA